MVVAKEFKEGAASNTADIDHIPNDHMGLDCGEKSLATIKSVIDSAKTVLWNGPLGVFELSPFDKGRVKLLHA